MSTPNTHFGADAIEKLLKDRSRLFFIGIGGVSMSSLAHISAIRGFSVSGSDRSHSKITDALEAAGISIFYSHCAENVADADAVIYTVAISEDNPEYVEAKRRGVPCISRADYLGYIMTAQKKRLGISGMHGKSTCTAMCAAVYMEGGDPTVVSGASSPDMGGYYRIGAGEHFIFEACEYMDSFLDFSPTSAIILNIEPEHLDYFSGIDSIKASFRKFAELTNGGRIIFNINDQNIVSALEGYGGPLYTFGIDCDNADYFAKNIKQESGKLKFDIMKRGRLLLKTELSVPGRHNILNALAAAAAADLDGISPDAIARGIAKFRGIGRRMEYKGKLGEALVYDDYAHHPTELRATLEAARTIVGDGKLTAVFQPHTYSRTSALFSDFAEVLRLADRVLLPPIYPARETDDLGISSKLLADAAGEKVLAFNSIDAIARELNSSVTDGVVVIMGAGNIDSIYKMLNIK